MTSEKKSVKESKESGPVIRIEMKSGDVHEVPIMSPLYSVLVGRYIDRDVGETYEDRCAASHDWLLKNDIEVNKDFMEFLKEAESILIYSDGSPLEGLEVMKKENQKVK